MSSFFRDVIVDLTKQLSVDRQNTALAVNMLLTRIKALEAKLGARDEAEGNTATAEELDYMLGEAKEEGAL
jgi:hypothetical protein